MLSTVGYSGWMWNPSSHVKRWTQVQFGQGALEPRLSVAALLFAIGLALVMGAVFGILPALRASRAAALAHLRSGLPVSIGGWWKGTGSHQVTVVDIMGAGTAEHTRVRVLNLCGRNNDDQWVGWTELIAAATPSSSFGSCGGGAKKKWAYYFTIKDVLRKRRWWMR